MIPLVEIYYEGKNVIAPLACVERLHYSETIYGGAAFEAVIGNWLSFKPWERILTSDSKEGQIRFGVEDDGGGRIWSDMKEVVFSSAAFSIFQGGATVVLSGTDRAFYLLGVCKERCYSNTKVSDVVTKIANDYELDSDVATTKGEFDLYSCDLTDWEFISEELLPIAVGEDDRGDFHFYTRNGDTIVFRPPEKEPQYYLTWNPFSEDTSASPVNMHVKYRLAWMDEERSLSVKVRDLSPLSKELEEFKVDDSNSKRETYAPGRPWPPDDPNTIVVGGFRTKEFRREEVEASARAIWGENCLRLWRARFAVTPAPDARIGVIARLTIKDSDGSDSFLTGDWLVYGVEQDVTPGGLTTTLLLERRGHHTGG